MNTSAQGLRVLVTAGAAGIGRAIAQTFAEHGARVHICDVAEAALEACGREQPDISHSLADVSRVDEVDRLFADVKRELGGLDVLVNNAGIAGPTAKVEEIQPADWERCIAVDLNGMFYCTRLAMPLLKANGRERGGSVINLSSVAGRLGGWTGRHTCELHSAGQCRGRAHRPRDRSQGQSLRREFRATKADAAGHDVAQDLRQRAGHRQYGAVSRN